MTQRNRRGVGGVRWSRNGGKTEPQLDHFLHLGLVGSAPSRDGVLHLTGCVLRDVTAAPGRSSKHDSTRLGDTDGGANVGLEKDTLDRNCRRLELVEQRFYVGLQNRESDRGVHVFVGSQHAERQCLGRTGGSWRQHGVTAARQTRVDPEHASGNGEERVARRCEHTFYRSASVAPSRGLLLGGVVDRSDELIDRPECETGDGAMGVADHAGGVDDEHAAPRETKRPKRAVCPGDRLVRVGKKWKTKPVLRGKPLVARQILRRHREHLRTDAGELREFIVVAVQLLGTDRRELLQQ